MAHDCIECGRLCYCDIEDAMGSDEDCIGCIGHSEEYESIEDDDI